MFRMYDQFANAFKTPFFSNEQFTAAVKNAFPASEQFANFFKTALPTNELVSEAAKANFESRLAAANALATKAFEQAEQVIDLNIAAAKATLEDSSAVAKQFLAAKDPQEIATLITSLAQPAVVKAIAYNRHLMGIAVAAQGEVSRVAEEQYAEARRKFSELIDQVAKSAPAGSENAFAVVKSVIDNANAGYTQFSKAAAQAAEVANTNVKNAANQIAETVEQTVAKAGKAAKQ